MDNVTLKQLRYFEALARHQHFGRAADACAISQPALSVQIKELEQNLGTPLFERTARQVRLTAFGAECVDRIRSVLQGVDELSEMARASGTGLSGRLRIGVIPTIAPYLLPALISRLNSEHPEIDVQIRETVTPRLVEELADGHIDTAIVALPIDVPAFEETALFEETMVLVRQAKDAEAPAPTADALRDMRLLLLEEGHCFRDQALSFCNLQSTTTREGLDGSSLSTLVQMVGAGIGVTLIPEMAVEVEARSAPVSISRFEGPQPTRTVGMIWRRTNPLAARLVQISEIVRSASQQVQRDFP
ncbi:LysR substrate-binding domain-containing protein [Yoonia sp. BS5-3]|uniref:LysR substrate-binding domain-containing protein n=1 Tax=Yoonia phaeophyticola TaxID=3137369 RepID=A0ABZ2V609_9RHOB